MYGHHFWGIYMDTNTDINTENIILAIFTMMCFWVWEEGRCLEVLLCRGVVVVVYVVAVVVRVLFG